ncbi:MAG: flagellar protein FlgN [Planctomycetota bacterium]|jgi:hypothetical protein
MECLEDEIRLQQGLHDLGARKRDELVRLDTEAMEKTSGEEQTVLVALGETAARRLKACQELARGVGIPDREATVRGLAAHLPLEQRTRMFALAQDLRGVMIRVARITKANRALTEQSLRYVHDFFGILTGASSGENTYGRTGPRRDPPGRLMIDHVA